MRKSIAAASFAGVMMLYGQSSRATLYYLTTAGSGSNSNWNINSIWYSTPTGTGGNAPPGSSLSSLDDFNINGKILANPTGSSTFAGRSIDLAGGTLILRNGGTKTVNLITGTGSSFITVNQPPTTLNVTTFNASSSSTTTLQETTGSDTTMANVDTYNIGTLTGSGNLALDLTASYSVSGTKTVLLSVTTGRAFTGNLSWSTLHTFKPILQFGNNLVLDGGLIATDAASRIFLNQDVTFASAKFNSTTLAPGTYTYASLKSSFSTIFNPGGSGSIIIPASSTWTDAGSGSWETPANWQGGYFPRLPGNIATFSAPAVNVPFTTTLNNDEAVGSLVFNGNGGPTTIAATSTFSLFLDNTGLGATIDDSTAAADVTVSAPVVLNDNLTISPSNSHNLTLAGAISNGTGGNHGLTVNATGTVYLSGANSYAGNTAVNSGVLNLSNSLALGGSTLTTGGIVFDSSVVTHAFTFGGLSGSENLVLQDNAGIPNAVALSVGNNNQSTTYSGTLSGPGSLTKIGTGSLTLPTAQTYAGNTTITAGTLIAANGSTGSATSTGNIIMGGGTLASPAGAGPTNTGTVSGALSGSGIIAPGGVGSIGGLTIGTLTTGSGLTLNFDLSGATAGDLLTVGGLTLGSAASPISFGTNPASAGYFRLIGGTIGATDPNTLFTLPAPPSTARYSLSNSVDPGYIDLAVIAIASSTWTSTSSGSWENSGNWQSNIIPGSPGNIATFSDPAVTGSITATLTANETVGGLVFNANGGPTTIAANSTFKLTLDNTPNAGAGVTLDASAAAADVTISAPLVLKDNVTATVNTGRNLTISGAISNSGSNHTLTINGSGTVVLSASNTYTGATTVNSGTLVVANSSGSATGTGNVTLNGGTLASGVTGSISGSVLAGSGAHTITPGGIGTIGALTVGGLNLSGFTTLNFDIFSPSTLDALTDSGALAISSGTVNVAVPTGLTGGTYKLVGYNTTSLTDASGFELNGGTTPPGYSLSLNTGSKELDLIISAGPNSLTWNNTAASGDGATWDTATNQNWSNGGTPAVFNTGDNVTFNDTNNGHYAVTLNSTVSPGSVTVDNSSGDYTISGSGSIAGAGGLTKTGSSALTLSTTNSYSGDTTVSAGTMTLSTGGTIASANVSVASGATLNLNGTLTATPNVTTTGTINVAPSSGGIQTRTWNALVVNGGGAVNLANTDSAATAGSMLNHPNRTLLVANSISNSGKIDLGGNDMLIHNADTSTATATLTALTTQLSTGYNANGAYWAGGSGIVSSAAAADSTFLTTLGIATGITTFDGGTILSTDVAVKYTYYGDADLSGTVDGTDYNQIDVGFASGGTLTGWQNGDFNYDDKIDGSDYALIDNAFNQQGSGGLASMMSIIAGNTAEIASSSASAVPEPTSLMLFGIGVAGLLGRRRRK